MNSKLTLPDIISALSSITGLPRTVSEKFVKTTFSLIAEALNTGENVKIKGLGTFKVNSVEDRKSVNVNTGEEILIPGHRKVSFIPEKALAERINAPFSMFEAIELNEEVSEQMLDASTVEVNTAASDDSDSLGTTALPERVEKIESNIEVGKTESLTEEDDSTHEEIASTQPSEVEVVGKKAEDNTEDALPVEPEESVVKVDKDECIDEKDVLSAEHTVSCGVDSGQLSDDNDDFSQQYYVSQCRAPRFWKGILLGTVASLICFVALLSCWRVFMPDSFCRLTNTSLPGADAERTAINATEVKPAVKTEVNNQQADTINEEEKIQPVNVDESDSKVAPTQVSDVNTGKASEERGKVYDTITTKRFLTTMAKEHYGNYNLWPYIYDENRNILGHPDRIKPGTKVVIPPADKYGIDANNPDCVARAKRRGVEIYAKYKK